MEAIAISTATIISNRGETILIKAAGTTKETKMGHGAITTIRIITTSKATIIRISHITRTGITPIKTGTTITKEGTETTIIRIHVILVRTGTITRTGAILIKMGISNSISSTTITIAEDSTRTKDSTTSPSKATILTTIIEVLVTIIETIIGTRGVQIMITIGDKVHRTIETTRTTRTTTGTITIISIITEIVSITTETIGITMTIIIMVEIGTNGITKMTKIIMLRMITILAITGTITMTETTTTMRGTISTKIIGTTIVMIGITTIGEIAGAEAEAEEDLVDNRILGGQCKPTSSTPRTLQPSTFTLSCECPKEFP